MPIETDDFALSQCNNSNSGQDPDGLGQAAIEAHPSNQAGVAMYLHATDELFGAVEGAGYFNNLMRTMGYQLNSGDMILSLIDRDGAPSTRMYFVDNVTGSSPADYVVDLSSGVTF